MLFFWYFVDSNAILSVAYFCLDSAFEQNEYQFETNRRVCMRVCMWVDSVFNMFETSDIVVCVAYLRVASFRSFSFGTDGNNFLLVLCTNISQLRARPTYRSTNNFKHNTLNNSSSRNNNTTQEHSNSK